MAENPAQMIRSWEKVQSFNNGPVVRDSLTPVTYGRVQTLHTHTWREEKLNSILDWDSEYFSIVLPESLRVISSVYLKIELPACGTGAFKKYPGIHAIKKVRILSNSSEMYTYDPQLFFHDYLESLSEEALRAYSRAYVGSKDTQDGLARSIMIPFLLPNSSYMGRSGDNLPHGIFPASLGSGRLEFQVTMNSAKDVAADVLQVPGSISGKCSLMYHQVEMDAKREKALADLRGKYSIMTRRFTELTNSWQVAAANTPVILTQYQPQGAVTELILIAVPDTGEEQSDPSRCGNNYVLPINFKITADSVVQKDLNTPEKVKAELWTNGFVAPVDFPSPGRLCFAAHSRSSDHVFSGAYKMTGASTIEIEFEFGVAVVYRLVAQQIQRVSLAADGQFRARLT